MAECCKTSLNLRSCSLWTQRVEGIKLWFKLYACLRIAGLSEVEPFVSAVSYCGNKNQPCVEEEKTGRA
jgi:hypothetical protein